MTSLIVLQDCATIQLSKGFNALVDAADFVDISQFKWSAAIYRGVAYAKRTVYLGKFDGKSAYRGDNLHRVLMGNPAGLLVDHKNGDTRDNRRENLRICTRVENRRNQRRIHGASRFKGVTPRASGRWMAQIGHDNNTLNLGTFDTEEEAALAYDAAAIRLHGSFSCTNSNLFGDFT